MCRLVQHMLLDKLCRIIPSYIREIEILMSTSSATSIHDRKTFSLYL
jgi:hypothetical protein